MPSRGVIVSSTLQVKTFMMVNSDNLEWRVTLVLPIISGPTPSSKTEMIPAAVFVSPQIKLKHLSPGRSKMVGAVPPSGRL